jgi:tetratricopeptide (TPR) repeat protein
MAVQTTPSHIMAAAVQTASERNIRSRALARNFDAAVALQRRGRLDDAASIYQSILAVDSNHFGSLHNLGYIRLQQSRRDEAAQLLRKGLKISPKSAQAWNTLGLVRHMAGEFRGAAACFEQALRYDPALAQAYNNLGASLHLLEDHERAIDCYRRALMLNSGYADAHRNLGNALKAVGRIEDAQSCYEAAIDVAPRQVANYVGLADCKRFAKGDRHLSAMEMLAREAEGLSDSERINLHFAMAKALADVGEHARSFAEVLAGNALKRQRLIYDEAATLQKFERIKAVFTPEFIRDRRVDGEPSEIPVFVVGMMRSGTTLIEQILASHPEVFGAGERGDFHQAVEAVMPRRPDGLSGYPEAGAVLSAKQMRKIGASYLKSIRKNAPSTARIIDKMPTNFLFAGLIATALPNARIVHARRNPVDTCLSCLSTDFRGDLPFTYDPGELGRYYQAYAALMRHWREALPPRTMIEVDYEELVSDLDAQARRLIAHCGLDWNPACLSFHMTQRVVLTASATQVRRPIYGDSVGRARAYGKALHPLIDALGLIEETAPP